MFMCMYVCMYLVHFSGVLGVDEPLKVTHSQLF